MGRDGILWPPFKAQSSQKDTNNVNNGPSAELFVFRIADKDQIWPPVSKPAPAKHTDSHTSHATHTAKDEKKRKKHSHNSDTSTSSTPTHKKSGANNTKDKDSNTGHVFKTNEEKNTDTTKHKKTDANNSSHSSSSNKKEKANKKPKKEKNGKKKDKNGLNSGNGVMELVFPISGDSENGAAKGNGMYIYIHIYV